jgi:hypothetical protein
MQTSNFWNNVSISYITVKPKERRCLYTKENNIIMLGLVDKKYQVVSYVDVELGSKRLAILNRHMHSNTCR